MIGNIIIYGFIIVLSYISYNLAAPTAPTSLILGHEAEQNEFPWQVSITNYLKNGEIVYCGGTLISSEWILTAASCLNNTKKILIGLGSNELRSPNIIMGIKNITISKDYKEKGIRLPIDNIAIIQMNGTVNLTEWIEPILLPGEDQTGLSFEGVKARVSGWGTSIIQTPTDNLKITQKLTKSDFLNWHELTVISNNECSTIYASDVRAESICTRVVSGGNVCGCDIGGPLVMLDPEGWKLIGVSSYTPGCDSTKPAVYSRITSYLSWISQVTGIQINLY